MAYRKEEKKEGKKITKEILEDCFALPTRFNGETIRCRYISWNGNPPKYDLRVWPKEKDGYEQCGKGFTLSGDELEELMKQLIKLSELTLDDLNEILKEVNAE